MLQIETKNDFDFDVVTMLYYTLIIASKPFYSHTHWVLMVVENLDIK